MASSNLTINDALHEYLMRETVAEPEVLERLREETAGLPEAEMQLQEQLSAGCLGRVRGRRSRGCAVLAGRRR